MKTSSVALILLIAQAGGVAAQGRPYVPDMTCRQAQALIDARGQIVLSTSPTTYDRFVSEDIFCEPEGIATPAFEPTRDNRECMIGYYCEEKEYESNH